MIFYAIEMWIELGNFRAYVKMNDKKTEMSTALWVQLKTNIGLFEIGVKFEESIFVLCNSMCIQLVTLKWTVDLVLLSMLH